MTPPLPCVLTINGGSSSIRFAIYDLLVRRWDLSSGDHQR